MAYRRLQHGLCTVSAVAARHTRLGYALLVTMPPIGGLLSFFLSLFVSLSATLRENGWTDLHEIFSEGVEWPSDDLIKFWVNSGKRVGGSKVNLLSPAIAIWFDCGLLAVLCCHLATENVMKLLFLPFGYIRGSTGAGFVVPRTTACFQVCDKEWEDWGVFVYLYLTFTQIWAQKGFIEYFAKWSRGRTRHLLFNVIAEL